MTLTFHFLRRKVLLKIKIHHEIGGISMYGFLNTTPDKIVETINFGTCYLFAKGVISNKIIKLFPQRQSNRACTSFKGCTKIQ